MDKNLQPIVEALEKTCEAQASEYRGDVSLLIPREKIAGCLRKAQRTGL